VRMARAPRRDHRAHEARPSATKAVSRSVSAPAGPAYREGAPTRRWGAVVLKQRGSYRRSFYLDGVNQVDPRREAPRCGDRGDLAETEMASAPVEAKVAEAP